ncbi:hypothetical protein [Flavobacterium anhuiense]|uniref:hypothetical protein n=1 Tax=Flavobacterium anhuiense TaxID=459526 RepID=UPI003D966900
MKKILFLILMFNFIKVFSQTATQEQIAKAWFDDYAVCKCITQTNWINGIKSEDKSILFYNKKLSLNPNNFETLESFIDSYIKGKIKGKGMVLKSCISIKYDDDFKNLVLKILKTDTIIKSAIFESPK